MLRCFLLSHSFPCLHVISLSYSAPLDFFGIHLRHYLINLQSLSCYWTLFNYIITCSCQVCSYSVHSSELHDVILPPRGHRWYVILIFPVIYTDLTLRSSRFVILARCGLRHLREDSLSSINLLSCTDAESKTVVRIPLKTNPFNKTYPFDYWGKDFVPHYIFNFPNCLSVNNYTANLFFYF